AGAFRWCVLSSDIKCVGESNVRVLAIAPNSYKDFPDLLDSMHRLRARVFGKRLNWDVNVKDGREADGFGDRQPTYILAVTGRNTVVCCARLLPATDPTLPSVLFPELAERGLFQPHATMIESSRFCVDTTVEAGRVGQALHDATWTRFAAIIEWSMARTAIPNSSPRRTSGSNASCAAPAAGLARVIIGAFMNAIYNRSGEMTGRALFLLDEVARLGFMRILETARDAGRKYGITLILLFQSIGQMRGTRGGRDAASKWFESTSWISFAAVNDPETADYISRRCGATSVEIDQISSSSQSSGSSRTRSKQLGSWPLIQPHEVLRMRADEQIVFTAGNAPLRCGRAIWFRRDDMKACVRVNRFKPEKGRAL
ncbi:type IV secretory system conjugative DNA transfer family protein, partial [Xanthobacter sediminis]|uniref:type IV secretory system conjugative DNA transfer family protein n=1 Tax=Xanthobacter sediminis TaxID=3119926 RepID=UPI0037263114